MSKKWITGTATLLLLFLLFAGYMAVAAEAGGTDPLVSVSYIEQLLPQLGEQIETEISTRLSEFDTTIATRVDELNRSIDDKIRGFEEQWAAGFTDAHFVDKVADAIITKGGVTANVTTGDTSSPIQSGGGYLFTVVEFPAGTTVILGVGTEVIWRVGTATGYTPGSPGLIDVTNGTDLSQGGQMQQNHLYVATVEGRGFRTTSTCRVPIKGEYSTQ